MKTYNFFKTKHFLILAILSFFLIVIGCFLDYIENKNLLNNGYINEKSITFISNTSQLNVRKGQGEYLLFQLDAQNPSLKHVIVTNEKILPSLIYFDKKTSLTDFKNKKIAIVGKGADKKNIPVNYKIIAQFKYSNSYKLNKDIWLISNENILNNQNGTHFVFSSPEKNTTKILNNAISEKDIKVIETTIQGTYLSKSNQILILFLKIGIIFNYFSLIFVGLNWIFKDKHLIRIIYISGYDIFSIFKGILKYRLVPYYILSALYVILSYLIDYFVMHYWTNHWLSISRYLLISYNLYLFMIALITILYFTYKKGGKRF